MVVDKQSSFSMVEQRTYLGESTAQIDITSRSVCLAAAQPSFRNRLGIRLRAWLTRFRTEHLSASLALPPATVLAFSRALLPSSQCFMTEHEENPEPGRLYSTRWRSRAWLGAALEDSRQDCAHTVDRGLSLRRLAGPSQIV